MARAVIMAGGQGERFWPLTRAGFPKYRMRFEGKESLLRRTYRRLRKVYRKESIDVVTTREHCVMIKKELPELSGRNILVEPFRNNTAAAIFFTSALIKKKYGDSEIVSFFPADHLIKNEPSFKKTLEGALRLAGDQEVLVTIGIKPTFPATAYGYIEAGRPIRNVRGAFGVKRFVEKPDLRKAKLYYKQKNFFWNGGIFTWQAGVLLDTMKKFSPKFYNSFDLNKLNRSYRRLPNLSIDYALLEKADNLAVYRTAMDWCDIGSWDMLYQKSRHDSDKNHGAGCRIARQTQRSLLLNYTGKPLVVLGVSDLIVAQTPQGTLICPRGQSDQAALLAKQL